MGNVVNGELLVTSDGDSGATSANQTNRTQKTQITDGTNDVDVSLVGSDYALKVDVVQSTGGAGTTQYAEDTASTPGESVVMVGVVRNDTRGSLVDTNGDRAELQVNASGDLRVEDATPTTIYNGKNTVAAAGTQEALASSQAVKSVTIKALASNTGLIYVGNSGVSSTDGFELSARDSVSLDITNLATVYIDSAVTGEGVTYIAVGV